MKTSEIPSSTNSTEIPSNSNSTNFDPENLQKMYQWYVGASDDVKKSTFDMGLKFLEATPGGKALIYAKNFIDCILDIPLCIHNGCKSLTFELGKQTTNYFPRIAVDTTGKIAFWSAKNVLEFSEWVGCTLTGQPSVGIHNLGRNCYRTVADNVNQLIQNVTTFIAPEAAEIAAKNASENFSVPPTESFSVSHLVGPSLLLALCEKKAFKNAQSSAYRIYLFVTGKRTLTTSFVTTAYSHTDTNNKVSVCDTTHHTSLGLARDAIMEALYTAAWLGTGYLTYEGMIDTLKSAGNSEPEAKAAVTGIATALAVAQVSYQLFKKAYFNNSWPDSSNPGYAFTTPASAFDLSGASSQEIELPAVIEKLQQQLTANKATSSSGSTTGNQGG